MFFLKQHNYEDVLGMTGLIGIRSYRKLFDGAFTVDSAETNIYKDCNGLPQKELILTCGTNIRFHNASLPDGCILSDL